MTVTHQGVVEWGEMLEEDLITFDGMDDAIVGIVRVYTHPTRVAYSYNALIDILMEQDMSYEDAVDYFEFNIGCLWAGEHTPAIVYDVGDRQRGLYSS